MDVCYVIGSGPSLSGFDFDKLPSGYRIGANKSGWLAKCDTLVSLDRNFPRKCLDDLRAFKGEIVLAARPDERTLDFVTYVDRRRGEQLSDDPNALHGYDSGYASLNLAYLRGFKEIALLGFDFKWVGSQTHFHNGYADQNRQTYKYLERWAKAFDSARQQLHAAGVSVTNFVGPHGSNVTAFPTRPLEDLY